MFVVTLIAGAWRFWKINQPLSDMYSWRQASTAMMAQNFYLYDFNPFFPAVSWVGPQPGYQGREFQTTTLLAASIYHVTGEADWVGRGIGALAGVWGVWALFLVVRRVWNEQCAIAAAAVMAIMPVAAFTDRSFLPDPMMVSLTTTGVWLWLDYLDKGGSRRLFLASLVWTLGILTKMPGLISIVPIFYACVCYNKASTGTQKKRTTGLKAGICFGLLLVVSWAAWAVYVGNHYPPYHVAGSGNFVWEYSVLQWVREGWYTTKGWHFLIKWQWTLPILGLMIVGLVFGPPDERRSSAERFAAPWLFHWWAIGGLILWLIAAKELVINCWNQHTFSPFVAAFAGRGMASLVYAGNAGAWLKIARAAAIGSIAILCSLGIVRKLEFPSARDSVAMGRALERLSRPCETVVTVASDVGDPIAVYYSRRFGWVYPEGGGKRPWNFFQEQGEKAIAEFESLRKRGANWFAAVAAPIDDSHPRRNFWDYHRQLVDHLNATCELVEKTDQYVIYRVPPSPAPS